MLFDQVVDIQGSDMPISLPFSKARGTLAQGVGVAGARGPRGSWQRARAAAPATLLPPTLTPRLPWASVTPR